MQKHNVVPAPIMKAQAIMYPTSALVRSAYSMVAYNSLVAMKTATPQAKRRALTCAPSGL